MNVEIEEQSKQWTHKHSPNKPKRQLVVGNSFLGQERSADCGIHAIRVNNSQKCIAKH
jgi:hypothetical protein